MGNNNVKRFISILLMLSLILGMAPALALADNSLPAAARAADEPADPGSGDTPDPEQPKVIIPEADALEHEHNSAGWSCEQIKNLICTEEEHTHSVEDGCYTQRDDAICGIAEGEGAHEHTDACKETEAVLSCGKISSNDAHEHTDDCYDPLATLICGYHVHDDAVCKDEDGNYICGFHVHEPSCYDGNGMITCEYHTHNDACYAPDDPDTPVCGREEAESHRHDEACYTEEEKIICGKEESVGHVHDEFECFYELTCDRAEHTHNENTDDADTCYELVWVCTNEFKLLTVEYRLIVDNTIIPIAETYQALLPVGYEYSLEGQFLPDLSGEGYVLKQAVKYTASAPDGDDTQTETIIDSNKLTGSITEDTKWILSYGYQDQLAPYYAYYYGHAANGGDETLLYAFDGRGPKDISIMVPVEVNVLLDRVLEAMDSDEVKPLGNGANMVQALIEKVDELNREKADPDLPDEDPDEDSELLHDITPLLKAIAKLKLGDEEAYIALSRTQIKQYIAENREKVYGLDLGRNQPSDAALLVTSDERAEKNLFYVAGDTYTVKFETGLTGAEVWGLTKFESEDDRPNITAPQPDDDGVVIEYAKNITENTISSLAGVDISDYPKNIYAKATAGGYRFVGWWWDEDGKGAYPITDYTADKAKGQYSFLENEGRIIKADQLQYIDKDTGELAGLTNMPSGGRTYYAIWEPVSSEYIVQVWFESEDGKFYYHDHELDVIARDSSIRDEIRYNSFDVERAAEKRVVDAANGEGSEQFPISFTDPESGVTDTYYGYADYMQSPFYGFDFFGCANDSGEGKGDNSCIHSLPHKNKVVNADGSVSYEDCHTEGNLCNCEASMVDPQVSKVLNVYYSREIWQIELHCGIWTYAFKDGNQIAGRSLTPLRQEAAIRHEAPDAGFFPLETEEYPEIGATVVPSNKNWEEYGFVDGNGLPKAEFVKTVTGRYGTTVPSGYEGTGEKWKTVKVAGMFEFSTIGLDGETFPLGDDSGNAYREDGTVITDEIDLQFKGLTTIDPYLFTKIDSGYIMTSAKIWKGDKFSAESAYDVGTNSYTYGTHKLELYPFFGNVENTFNVDYYVQTLPGETAEKTDAEGIGYKKTKTDSVVAPYDMLSYSFTVPEGFTALKWTDELKISAAASFANKKTLSAAGKAAISTHPNTASVPAKFIGLTGPYGNHNAGFGKLALTGHNVYGSTWDIWQAANGRGIVGYFTPMNYWITDWVRAADEGGNEYSAKTDGTVVSVDKLVADSEGGDIGSQLLLEQLRSTVRIGYIHPMGLTYNLLGTNQEAYNSTGTANQADGSAVILFARNKHLIRYNTCFLDKDGKLLTNDYGVVYERLYTTPREIYYDQELGREEDPLSLTAAASRAAADNNYYNAYFAYDAAAHAVSTLTGSGGQQLGPVVYSNDSAREIYNLINPANEADKAQYENTSLIGGYGHWYLDPDGTIPFTEENLAKMPDGDIDVYYHYSNAKYKVVYVDELNMAESDTTQISKKDDTTETVTHVQVVQTIAPNGKPMAVEHLENDAYVFAGWYQEPEGIHLFDFGKEITEDTVIYAVWRPKVPTTYEIRHVLVDKDGKEIGVIEVEKGDGYVDDTIHGKALQNVYSNGLYYVADDYSRSMVLVENPDSDTQNNVLIFQYRQPMREYLVQYRDINDPDHKLLPDKTVQTNYRQVTEKYAEIDGWEYVGNTTYVRPDLLNNPYATVQLVDGQTAVITFWYQQNPEPTTVELPVAKHLNGQPTVGTAYNFELKNEEGEVIDTAQAVDGVVKFKALPIDAEGVYTYTISEVIEDDEDIIYDDSIFTVKVDARIAVDKNRNPNRYFDPVITYYKDGALYNGTPVFENRTSTPDEPLVIPDLPDFVQTGDDSNLGLYAALLAASLLGLGAAVFCLRRRKTQEK